MTAGVSANQYMEQVTSFSASLISSLGGDTKKASEIANRAVMDMADNANTSGSSMESIQNAYQGFAKGNYTMLDNLKLGFGGTKTEMQRLIKEASQMKDIQKELNIQVKNGDMSFSNIANAISVMQSKLKIAGTTEKEAMGTLQGSMNMLKASWQNFLTGTESLGPVVENARNSF
jgi:phage-related protein